MTLPPLVLFFCLALISPRMAGAQDPTPARAEAELKAVRSQIDKVRAEMERDAGRRDQLTRELEESEKSVGTARGALEKLRRERAQHTARRAEKKKPSSRRTAARSRDRSAPPP